VDVENTKADFYPEIVKQSKGKTVADLLFHLRFHNIPGVPVQLKENGNIGMMIKTDIFPENREKGCDKDKKKWY